jgi:hypothetical protein
VREREINDNVRFRHQAAEIAELKRQAAAIDGELRRLGAASSTESLGSLQRARETHLSDKAKLEGSQAVLEAKIRVRA